GAAAHLPGSACRGRRTGRTEGTAHRQGGRTGTEEARAERPGADRGRSAAPAALRDARRDALHRAAARRRADGGGTHLRWPDRDRRGLVREAVVGYVGVRPPASDTLDGDEQGIRAGDRSGPGDRPPAAGPSTA